MFKFVNFDFLHLALAFLFRETGYNTIILGYWYTKPISS